MVSTSLSRAAAHILTKPLRGLQIFEATLTPVSRPGLGPRPPLRGSWRNAFIDSIPKSRPFAQLDATTYC
jgi:hypothetical protein